MKLFIDIVKDVSKNLAMRLPLVSAWRRRRPRGSLVFRPGDPLLEKHAFQSVQSLLGELGSVRGRHILEIGPGDHLGSGFALLAAGAGSYTALDRFPGDYQDAAAKAWYRGIQAAWPRVMPHLPWPADLDAERFPEAYPNRVHTLSVGVEQATLDRKFDVVYSHAVGEHVSDIQAFARITAGQLAPEGVAFHCIDLGPHQNWSAYSDPLTFLRFSDGLWRLMGSNRGTPNRFRHHEFLDAFAAVGLEVRTTKIETFPGDRIDRSRLARRFQEMPSESLATKSATYVCRRAA